jgi:dihydroorotate dehydrogenase
MAYRSLLRPLLFRLQPETAHHLALNSLSVLGPLHSVLAGHAVASDRLKVERFGFTFVNPVGLAAGFDKDGIALKALANLGFGHIEAGTVTFHAQPGNPLPRLFRLPVDKALINRAGFNNEGAAAFARRVRGNKPDCVLGVSIGKSKVTPIDEAVEDYLSSLDLVYDVADYVAVNVSSPNTPQLRELQQAEQLRTLLNALKSRCVELQLKTNRTRAMPLLVKLSPDLTEDELAGIVEAIKDLKVDGIIATNTTTSRENLKSTSEVVSSCGNGGLSGKPLRDRSTDMVAAIYRQTSGQIPIIGVGGIFNGEDAWAKIGAGASLVQLYTGFIYEGPRIANLINEVLLKKLDQAGFKTIEVAVGHSNK